MTRAVSLRRRLAARIATMLAVLLLVSAATFALTNLLPGDPAVAYLGPAATPEALAELRHDLDLDHPVPVRYARWLSRVVRGDLGRSYRLDEPVSTVLGRTIGVTAELVVLAEIAALALGVPIGVWAAHRANRRFDKIASAGSFALLAVPQFALAVVLVLVFAERLNWFDTIGFVRLSESVGGNLRSLVLPTVTLALPIAALYARIVRTDMFATLQSTHVELARAMGLPARRILFRHALRQSSLTLMTIVGVQFGALLGGSLLVEQIFAIPGMGRLLIDRIAVRDYTVVQGGVLLVAAAFVLSGFLVDLVQSVLDPRIRHDGAIR